MAVATTGERIIFLSSLGSTETAPAALARTWESEQPGNIGVPMRGVELKLVPSGGKLEAPLQGAEHHAGLLAAARPHQGRLRRRRLLQDGRRAQVRGRQRSRQGPAVRRPPRRGFQARERHLGQRRRVARPVHRSLRAARPRRGDRRRSNRDDIAALVFPDVEACRKLAGIAADAPPAAVLADPKVRDEFKKRLNALARQSTGGSTRICRIILMAEPPSLDAGEATDKGSINQRAVLTRRAALVEELYAPRRRPTSSRSTNGNKPHGPQRTRRHRHRSRLRARRRDRGAAGRGRRQGRLPRHQSRRARKRRRQRSAASPSRCDVTSSDSAEAALKEARDKHGPARILVNCAGIGPAKRMVGRDGPMPLADFEKVIAINLTGTFNMMRLVAADMQNALAARRRRARRDRLDRVGRGLRRPDRPGAPMRRRRAASRR